MWQWAQDSGFTPQLLVDATVAEVVVPVASVESGRIVLNVHERAVVDLEMGNDLITFSARFGGLSQAVVVPVDAVLASLRKRILKESSFTKKPVLKAQVKMTNRRHQLNGMGVRTCA